MYCMCLKYLIPIPTLSGRCTINISIFFFLWSSFFKKSISFIYTRNEHLETNFFFSFLASLRHVKFLGQGSDLSHSCNICCCSCSKAESLIAGVGPNLCPVLQRCHVSLCATAGTPLLKFKQLVGLGFEPRNLA